MIDLSVIVGVKHEPSVCDGSSLGLDPSYFAELYSLGNVSATN